METGKLIYMAKFYIGKNRVSVNRFQEEYRKRLKGGVRWKSIK